MEETVKEKNAVVDLPSDASPEFQVWYRDAIRKPHLLEQIFEALRIAGVAQDKCEALSYLSNLSTEHGVASKVKRYAFGDVAGLDAPNPYASQLRRRIMSNRKRSKAGLYMFFGRLGHQAIPSLFTSGHHRSRARLLRGTNDLAKQPFLPFQTSSQFELFNQNLKSNGNVIQFLGDMGEKWTTSRYVFKQVEKCWTEAVKIIEDGDNQFFRHATVQLERAILPLYGEYVQKVLTEPWANSEAKLLTLTSWAAAALYYYRETGKRILFQEVEIMARERGFSGGRLDAIELRRVDGRGFKKSQIAQLSALFGKMRIKSTGKLLQELSQLFINTDVKVEIKDWKFAVGDSPNGTGIIQPSDLFNGPFSEHKKQVLRYLSLAFVDFYHEKGWHRNTGLERSELKDPHGLDINGGLEYFLPSGVVCHNIEAVLSDYKETLLDIANGLKEAPMRAIVRVHWNFILLHAIHCLDGNNNLQTKKQQLAPVIENLFPDDRSAIPYLKRYEEVTVFADQYKIIEIVRKNSDGELIHKMYYNRLLEGISSGDIAAAHNFRADHNSFISCLLHQERTPSMHIRIQAEWPSFHCFGCGVWGYIDRTSIPEDLDVVVRLGHGSTGRWKTGVLPMISDAHHKLMGLAQEILRSEFKGSIGERYLVEERCLDSDLAYQMGAGFGTGRLINELMDHGYTLDDLISAGLVGISDKIDKTMGLGPLLVRRGMPSDQMIRMVGRKKSEVVIGYPWFLFQDRVTFPLKYKDASGSYKNTNFYGRAVDAPWFSEYSSKLKHIKASNEFEQGGFNMEVLESESEEIISIEAAICVVTLAQMGWSNGFGLIGSDNYSLFDCVKRSGKKLALGLDIDPDDEENPTKGGTGQKKTEKITEVLKKMDYHLVRNFTMEFIETMPVGAKFKDWNQWFVDIGRHLPGYKK